MVEFDGFKTEMSKNMAKTRCFFANKRIRARVCDSNHKKRLRKSSTISSPRINGFTLLVISSVFNSIEKEKVNEMF